MIHWGIIGAGKIAKRFAASLAYETDAELYAISGRNMEKMKTFQNEHPCRKIYTDFDQLLKDEQIDAVYIALPHNMHEEWAVKALHAHKAVLCEKPAVMRAEEMEQIASVSRQEKVLFMEAMKSRFEPAYIQIKELLQKDTIGSLISVKAEICSAFPKEFYGTTYLTEPGVGGALHDTGCYCVNWLNDLLKDPPEIVNVDAAVKNGVDYYVDAKMKFGQVNGEVIAGIDRAALPQAELIGTKGKIIVEHPHRPDAYRLCPNGKEEVTYAVPYIHDDFYGQIHAFDALLKEGKKESDVMSLQDSIRNAQIIDLISSCFHEADWPCLEG